MSFKDKHALETLPKQMAEMRATLEASLASRLPAARLLYWT